MSSSPAPRRIVPSCRVALVSEHASPLACLGTADAGGQNVHVAALASGFSALGYSVDVYTRRDDPTLPEVVDAPGGYRVIHVVAGPPEVVPKDHLLPHMFQFADALADLWSGPDRPDIAHSHFWMSGLASVAAAASLEIPLVHTYHALGTVKRRYQGDADSSPAARIRIERALLDEVDHVIATCTDELFELVRMGADRQRVSIVPCGVDLDLFTPLGPSAPRHRGHRVVVVGRLVERKGLAEVIEAVANLPGVELVIAGGPDRTSLGDDPDARRVLGLAHRFGLDDRFEMCGQVGRDELPKLLRSADVIVCAPWYEPFGIVPLEAMACARPVVASAVGGLLDTVVDGVTGRHVRPRDPAQLASVLGQLLNDAPMRQSMGRAGRRRAERRYRWSRVVASTEKCYSAVLSSGDRVAQLSRRPS